MGIEDQGRKRPCEDLVDNPSSPSEATAARGMALKRPRVDLVENPSSASEATAAGTKPLKCPCDEDLVNSGSASAAAPTRTRTPAAYGTRDNPVVLRGSWDSYQSTRDNPVVLGGSWDSYQNGRVVTKARPPYPLPAGYIPQPLTTKKVVRPEMVPMEIIEKDPLYVAVVAAGAKVKVTPGGGWAATFPTGASFI